MNRLRKPIVRCLTGVAWLLAAAIAVWALHPWPLALRWLDPATTAYIDHREREAADRGEPFDLRRSWIGLDEMPAHLVTAVLIAEDHRFRDHGGVDWEALADEARYRGAIPPRITDPDDRAAIREAVDYVRAHRDEIRGRSTLTQQLARNLYLSPDRSFIRKGQELLIARRLELVLSKDRILELYLNVAEMGPGIFGVEAAGQAYFGRSARELTQSQAASLAATLPHPLTSNPASNPGRMAWRRDLILERMRSPEPDRPLPDPIEVAPPRLPPPDIPAPDSMRPASRTRPASATGRTPARKPPLTGPGSAAGPEALTPAIGPPPATARSADRAARSSPFRDGTSNREG